MRKKKVLNIISDNFPYGLHEQFFEAEVEKMATFYDEVVIFPLKRTEGLRTLPANIKVNNVLNEVDRSAIKKQAFFSLGLILKIVGFEFIHSNKRVFLLKKIKWWASSITYCKRLSEVYFAEIDKKQHNHHYSFWMNDGALLLSILRSKKKIDGFDFRVNGLDIFEERQSGNYMPFRYYNYKHVNRIYVLSNVALEYLREINYNKHKLIYAPYGVYAKGLNKLEETDQIHMVSCANMIPLKRIDKIISALKLIKEKNIRWTHFGDGYLRPELEQQIKELPANIRVEFKGHVHNEEVINLYKNQSVNLFIHTSETEGLGMAIIEAQSFGIPALVIGVGGVLDIVSNETGLVLSPKAEGTEIAVAVLEIINGEKNSQAYRTVIQKHCMNIFNADKNYAKLYKTMSEKIEKR